MKKLFRVFFISFFFIFIKIQISYCEERAYITNWESDNISVIQLSNDTVIETIPTVAGPLGLAFTPDYKYVYVTNYGMAACNNKVTVIQTSDNTVQCVITVGNCPAQIAITPDGELGYVANYFGDTFSVIEISTNSVVATVPIGNGPMGVSITPDGQYAYFAMEQEGTVKVVQISDNTVIATISVGSSPYRIAFTPDGAYAYVTNRFSNNVSVIQTSDNTVIATIGVGGWPHGVAITPDGEYAYVVNFLQSNSVSVIQTSTNSVVNTISVGSAPKAIAFTLDGEYAYVTNGGSNSVSVIEISTGTVVETIPVNTNPSGIIIGNCPEVTGWIEGTVSLEGGSGNVEDVVITAGFECTKPDASGFYSIEIEPGIYNVTATLKNYIPYNDTVTVITGQTSIVDIVLYSLDFLAPPENLTYNNTGDYLTWDPPQTILDWISYNVYRDNTIIATIPDTSGIFFNPSPGIYFLTAVYKYGESVPSNIVEVPTVGTEDRLQVQNIKLNNYPNPFNELTVISYTLKVSERVSLKIYDMQGHETRTLVNEKQTAGKHSVIWDGTDDRGMPIGPGVYICRLQVRNLLFRKKIIVQ